MSRPLLSRAAERVLGILLRGPTGPAVEATLIAAVRRMPGRVRGTAALVNAMSRRPRTDDLVARLDFGARMVVPSIPEGAAYHVVGHHGERDTVALLEAVLTPGDVFVDVGANLGYYTLLAARLVGPAGRVVAVEAQPRLIPYLRRSCELNDVADRVTIIHAAVGARDGGSATLFLAANPETTGTPSLLRHEWLRGGESVEVPAVTLDAALAQAGVTTVDVIKIDIEGGELAALEGMRGTLRQHVRLVVCELLPRSLVFASIDEGAPLGADPAMGGPGALVEAFGELGYSSYWITSPGAIGKPLSPAELDRLTWSANVAFVSGSAGAPT